MGPNGSDNVRKGSGGRSQGRVLSGGLHSASDGQGVASSSVCYRDNAAKRQDEGTFLKSRLPRSVDLHRDAFGNTSAERNALGYAVLLRAFDALCAEGWCPPRSLAQLGNREPPPGIGSGEALGLGATDPTMRGEMHVEYARRMVRRIEADFHGWEQHPFRHVLDVLRLLQAACAAAGFDPPSLPARLGPKRRGGWVVSSRVGGAR